MAEKKGISATAGCLIALLVAMFGGVVVLGIAAAVVVSMGPTWLFEAATEPAPQASSHEASAEDPRAIRERFVAGLHGESHTARLTGPELTTLLRDQVGAKGQGGVTLSNGIATLDLSVDLAEPGADPAWLNLHTSGSFTLEKGWATAASVESLDVSGWELGPLLQDDAQLVQQINQQLANQRGQDPSIGPKLDALERVTVDGDALVVTVTAEGAGLVSGPR